MLCISLRQVHEADVWGQKQEEGIFDVADFCIHSLEEGFETENGHEVVHLCPFLCHGRMGEVEGGPLCTLGSTGLEAQVAEQIHRSTTERSA